MIIVLNFIFLKREFSRAACESVIEFNWTFFKLFYFSKKSFFLFLKKSQKRSFLSQNKITIESTILTDRHGVSNHHKFFPCLFLSIKLFSQLTYQQNSVTYKNIIFMYKLLLYFRCYCYCCFQIFTLITRRRRQLFYLFFCALMHIAAVFHVLTW